MLRALGIMIVLVLLAGASAARAQNLAFGRPVTASSVFPGWLAEYAVDADTVDTGWNAGNYGPAWIEIDLGTDVHIDRVEGLAAVSPPASFRHSVSGRTSAGATYNLAVYVGSASNHDRVVIPCAAEPPAVRFVRVSSESQLSWIAWWDLRVFAGPGVPQQTTAGARSSWTRVKTLYR